MEAIGALDQGTQSTRFFLFDRDFSPLSGHQVIFPQIHPQAGWCEHNPLEIWHNTQECIFRAVQEAEERYGPIKVLTLGITNQRETTVVWHRITGQPLYNAIVWLDNRTGDLCKKMEEELGTREHFRERTGLPISTYFSAFKMMWLYENVEDVRIAVDADECCFGTVDSWLLYKLTGGPKGGVHVTDVTNASRTLLMDLKTCQWHQPYLELFHVKESCLPKIVSCAEVYGNVATGVLAGVPIAGCLGDQMAALLGHRCQKGEAKNTYGTGCFMLLNTGDEIRVSSHGLLTSVGFKLGKDKPVNYVLEGSIAVAGLGLTWLKDNLGMMNDSAESESIALQVDDTAGCYFVPAFAGLMAPHWQPEARGAILGLTGYTTKAHIVRAMLEAICFQAREVMDAMRQDAAGMELKVLRVDGGCCKNDTLMQLQADILQASVTRPFFQETTALGAALAAGLATGIWTEEQIFTPHDSFSNHYHPIISLEQSEKRYRNWKKAVTRSLDLADLLIKDE